MQKKTVAYLAPQRSVIHPCVKNNFYTIMMYCSCICMRLPVQQHQGPWGPRSELGIYPPLVWGSCNERHYLQPTNPPPITPAKVDASMSERTWQESVSPYKPLYNSSYHFIFYFLFRLILHYYGIPSQNPNPTPPRSYMIKPQTLIPDRV